MVAEGIGGVRCSEPCTSLISVESLCLVKGSDCQTHEGTGGKKTNCEGRGGVHCGSPRAVFTLRLMRGEVVNLGNKAWGIPCCHRRCRRCMVRGAIFFFFFFFLTFSLVTIKQIVERTFCWDVACRRGRGVGLKEWGMKADFLLAVLARRCISCPTTAEWDGWLIWTINIAVSNWCHITLLLSPEERGSNQAVWVRSQRPEPGMCGDQKRGSNFFRVPIQLFGKTLQRSMDVATSSGKVLHWPAPSFVPLNLTTPKV